MYTEETMLARYKQLCAMRDEVYETNAPLEKALAKANAEAEEARIRAASIAAEIDKNFIAANWFALKREISLIAHSLGRPNGPLATKE
jgi:hypothetical protein